jgi:hypothetical protein
MTLLKIFGLLFKRRTTGYYFLAKSLMWISVPLITSTPWWTPFLKPILEDYLKISIEVDFVLSIGFSCLIFGIIIGFFAVFKDKQISHDKMKLVSLNNILNEIQFNNILDTFSNNAHILKSDRTNLELFFSHLKEETNRFKHPIINCRLNKLLKTSAEFDNFICYKIFDLNGQTTNYHYFLPDQNIDQNCNASTEKQIEFDNEFKKLTLIINRLKRNYKNLLKSHRRLT